MVTSDARTVEEYLAAHPEHRRRSIETVLDVVRQNLPDGFAEGVQYGMIGWYVPLERFSDSYNGQPLGLAALASQKQYMSLYLNSVYGDPATERWFHERWSRTGKKLSMGKSCVRFRDAADLPLEVIAETIARVDLDTYLARYAEARGSSRRTRASG